MKQKEITIGGKTYPVVFNFDAMMNFEEIVDKEFHKANFGHLKDRMALVYASVISADDETELKIQDLKGDMTLDAVNELIAAYNIVMELVGDFFKVPKVVGDAESSECKTKGDGTDSKN
ncbi:MAG: hypothetical protein IKQ53_06470 [Bacteroidales bacterium]|nr:hypothetical protein [Bacteroidales bacterium]